MNEDEAEQLAAFTVIDREGACTRQELRRFPFKIGRQSGNDLVLRDARASRHHAQVSMRDGEFYIEDLGSRHGLYVNGSQVHAKKLDHGDRVEFGFEDSYRLIFERPGNRLENLAEHLNHPDLTSRTGTGGNLTRLRAMLEVTRALQSSFSVDAVLEAVVDAALVITNADRCFLLLKTTDALEVRCARDRRGPLPPADLDIPRNLIRKAMEDPASTFSVQFSEASGDPSESAFALQLKSAVSIPLVRIHLSAPAEGLERDAIEGEALEKIGALYMDSRKDPRDMSLGNRELLETLAIEASAVLENARLLQDERARQHMNEELSIARGIQQSLLPRDLPKTGWLRALGTSLPSRQVGGDYFDLFQVGERSWAVVVADVAGKGVSSALVASLLQGAFLALEDDSESLRRTVTRVNAFFRDRTDGQKYATLFCALIDREGGLRYVNAGHCGPMLVHINDPLEVLGATGPPVGLLDTAHFETGQYALTPLDRLVIYTDGVTEAQNAEGEFFGRERLTEVLGSSSDRPCAQLHDRILDSVQSFTGGQEQGDDQTLVVLEYRPD